MGESDKYFQKCLLIGGPSDGMRTTVDTRASRVRVLPPLLLAPAILGGETEPVNEPTPDLSEVYVRSLLRAGSREYFVYVHESIPVEDTIEALIGGYHDTK